jgi:hypothetical protein
MRGPVLVRPDFARANFIALASEIGFGCGSIHDACPVGNASPNF